MHVMIYDQLFDRSFVRLFDLYMFLFTIFLGLLRDDAADFECARYRSTRQYIRI